MRTLQRYVKLRSIDAETQNVRLNTWMHDILQGAKTCSQIIQGTGDKFTAYEINILINCIKTKSLHLRNRALTILAYGNDIQSGHIASFLCISRNTTRNYIHKYKTGGLEGLFDKSRKGLKKGDDPGYSSPVFSILHAPPSTFGLNRTSWRMDDLYSILHLQGIHISRWNIRKIIRNAGYRFRQAKVVLTSTDPDYQAKLHNITRILGGLKTDEKFFSIDEFGPFAVCAKGGIALVKPGETKSIPQWQKTKGSLIATAALELSTNQITHFYSTKKNTTEMIRMLEILVEQYHDQSRIFFSWDAASWHGSKMLLVRVNELNDSDYRREHGTPIIEFAPLPSCAQFLNVIESVFSGMARAIIHNSDYASVEVAKIAIDRYFAERNAHFQEHPKRAGKRIWGKELVDPEFNEANNCKDPRWSWR